jgi:hypothetical protein
MELPGEECASKLARQLEETIPLPLIVNSRVANTKRLFLST